MMCPSNHIPAANQLRRPAIQGTRTGGATGSHQGPGNRRSWAVRKRAVVPAS